MIKPTVSIIKYFRPKSTQKNGVAVLWMLQRMKRRGRSGIRFRKYIFRGKAYPRFREDLKLPDAIVWVRYSGELFRFVSERCQMNANADAGSAPCAAE